MHIVYTFFGRIFLGPKPSDEEKGRADIKRHQKNKRYQAEGLYCGIKLKLTAPASRRRGITA